jgi:Fic family protein
LLYLSSYFERRRSEYADRLQAVRERGLVQEWLQFFLRGVLAQAADAVDRAERLADLREKYRRWLTGTRSRANEVIDLLFENPIITGPSVSAKLGMTWQGAKNLLADLERREIVVAFESRPGGRRSWLAREILETVGE